MKKAFENIVRKGENGGSQRFRIFFFQNVKANSSRLGGHDFVPCKCIEFGPF